MDIMERLEINKEKNMDIRILKKRKKELKFTFEELSQKSGVPIQTLHNIFRGHTVNPRVDTMQAIERALGIGGQSLEWTEEDKALGVGNHSVPLSADDWEWLELKSETLRLKGEEYYEMLKRMIKAAIEIK